MRGFLVVVAITSGALAGEVVAAPSKAPSTKVTMASKRIDAAKSQVLDALKDPDSAKFKQIHIAADGEAVCGSVNSKNSMGGYAGFESFVVEPDGRIFFDSSGPSFPGMIRAECGENSRREQESP